MLHYDRNGGCVLIWSFLDHCVCVTQGYVKLWVTPVSFFCYRTYFLLYVGNVTFPSYIMLNSLHYRDINRVLQFFLTKRYQYIL